jgi:hypothetical protein
LGAGNCLFPYTVTLHRSNMQLGSLSWEDITAIVAAFVLWRLVLYFTRKSVFDDLRGPPGAKLVAGVFGDPAGD